ncbi:MAG: hypothetical protein ACO3OO_05240, partial [Gemmobacter sp.]
HGYVTAADFVRGRFGNRGLSLAVAATGIIATMPYIALQLVGMQVVLAAMGANFTWTIPGFGAVDAPLLIAFTVLAFYTYSSGLRAPAHCGRRGAARDPGRGGRDGRADG